MTSITVRVATGREARGPGDTGHIDHCWRVKSPKSCWIVMAGQGRFFRKDYNAGRLPGLPYLRASGF
jgi:hypothetical protein